jgi:hypothetical protein
VASVRAGRIMTTRMRFSYVKPLPRGAVR